MDIFGSREEDPLLQDDPLAPSSEEGASEDNAEGGSAEEDSHKRNAPKQDIASEEASSTGFNSDASPTESIDDDHLPTGTNEEREDSVFRNTAADQGRGPHFRFDGTEDTRVVVRSGKEAAEGRLTVINAALEEGWQLGRVEVQENDPSASSAEVEASSKDTSITLAFVLHRAVET